MRYETKLFAVSGAMLFLSLFAAGMAYWGVERSYNYFERSRSSHQQLEAYLSLSAHTYELFKQWSDAMLIGETAQESARSNLSRQIEADINILRLSVLDEIGALDADEKAEENAELTRISDLRGQLVKILHKFGKIELLALNGKPTQAREELAVILQESIDKDFRFIIDQAIADEVNETLRIDAKAADVHRDLVRATQIHAVFVTLFIVACLYFLLKRLRQPLLELLEGTRALSSGKLSYRIHIGGQDEFAELGTSFNEMAKDLDSKRTELEKIQASLEEEVESRTEELQAANDALEKVDVVRRQFFADISHELRTPLTVIRGESQITLRGNNKEIGEYKQALTRILEQAKHLGILVNDLLFIARENLGELRLKHEDVRLVALLKSVFDDAQVIAEDKNIDLRFSVPDDSYIYAGDEGRLRQLFLILFDNAICYSPPDSLIEVSVQAVDDALEISVADQGIGIPEEELELVFERFGRGSNAQVHHAEGIGLGLPLAKSITEAHGGTVRVDSTLNQGTTITIRFGPVTQIVDHT